MPLVTLLDSMALFSWGHADVIPWFSVQWWCLALASVVLVLFGGLMSGLAVGLLALSPQELEVLRRSGTDEERRQAGKILPVVKNQHELLVTLLVCNALASEALPIFLDGIFPSFVAVILSVTFVLMFGEIIPQAVCSRHGLAIGASMVGLVRVLLFICWPVSFPIGRMLDKALGDEEYLLQKEEALSNSVTVGCGGGRFSRQETTITGRTQDLMEKTAGAVMAPIDSTFSIPLSATLDREVLAAIKAAGHSRIPIYKDEPNRLVGVLLATTVVGLRPEDRMPVRSLPLCKMPTFPADMPLYTVLNILSCGGSHVGAVVRSLGSAVPDETKAGKGAQLRGIQKGQPLAWERKEEGVDADVEGDVVGIITLEDVIEGLLQEKALDVADACSDVRRRLHCARKVGFTLTPCRVEGNRCLATTLNQATLHCSAASEGREKSQLISAASETLHAPLLLCQQPLETSPFPADTSCL